MTDLRTSAKAVLELYDADCDIDAHMEALRQALAEPVEPVMWWNGHSKICKQASKDWDARTGGILSFGCDIPLYTTPPSEPVEPVAWINVEKRKLEWNTDFPVRWETPTVVKLDKLPLYTTPPSVDALIAEAVAKEREACAQVCDSMTLGMGDECAGEIRARGQK